MDPFFIEGNYTLQPTLCNMQPHWTNMSKTCSIWFFGRWVVGPTSHLGQNIGVVLGPHGEEDWPQNISSGWKYGDVTGTWVDAGTDLIFEAKLSSKIIKILKKLSFCFLYFKYFICRFNISSNKSECPTSRRSP